MEKILVSACLPGTSCRWHGQKVRPSSYVKKFIRENPEVKVIPVCPEELGGLPTPRPPTNAKEYRYMKHALNGYQSTPAKAAQTN